MGLWGAAERITYVQALQGRIASTICPSALWSGFVVHDGKIQSVKEYLDTTHAADMLCSSSQPRQSAPREGVPAELGRPTDSSR
jgi:hypothetical protein